MIVDIDLISLERILMGDNALLGDNRDVRKGIPTYPYNFKNNLILRSLCGFDD